MLRITLTGDDLAGFDSPSPGDHIKLFFPGQDGRVEARDYTPRRFNVEDRSLAVDFVLHEGGVGSTWARHAVQGDHLQIGGPRGSMTISAPGAWGLLIGDKTSVPSIGRRLEEMAPGTQMITVITVGGPEEHQLFETRSDLKTHWIHRPSSEAADPTALLRLVFNLALPEGPGFIWIAGEEEVSRAVRAYFVDSVGHPPEWIKASAYCRRARTKPREPKILFLGRKNRLIR